MKASPRRHSVHGDKALRRRLLNPPEGIVQRRDDPGHVFRQSDAAEGVDRPLANGRVFVIHAATPGGRRGRAGERHDEMPAETWKLDDVEPIVEDMPGWSSPTRGAKSWEDLPPECRDYVARIGELVGCEVGLLSVGAERRAIISVPGTKVDSWLNGGN